MLDAGLYSFLTTALPDDTFYALRLPQKNAVYPNTVIKVIATNRVYALGAYSGFTTARVELHCRANSKVDSIDLAERIRNKLDTQSGLFGSVVVDNCLNESQFDMDPELLDEGSDKYRYRIVCGYRVIYRESQPTL